MVPGSVVGDLVTGSSEYMCTFEITASSQDYYNSHVHFHRRKQGVTQNLSKSVVFRMSFVPWKHFFTTGLGFGISLQINSDCFIWVPGLKWWAMRVVIFQAVFFLSA